MQVYRFLIHKHNCVINIKTYSILVSPKWSLFSLVASPLTVPQAPENYWSVGWLCNFAFSKVSYKWNIAFLIWYLSLSILPWRIFHTVAFISSLLGFCFLLLCNIPLYECTTFCFTSWKTFELYSWSGHYE